MEPVDNPSNKAQPSKSKLLSRPLVLALCFVSIGLTAGYALRQLGSRSDIVTGLNQPYVPSSAVGLVIHSASQSLPDVSFQDGTGLTKRLSDLRGRTLLVNLWATWCAPCKREMPALNRLQQKFGGDAFTVVAIATDRTGLKEPRAFLEKAGIQSLALFGDDTAEIVHTLKAEGLPLTLIVNQAGQEIARLLGPADWDSAEVQATIASLIAKR